MIVSGPGIAILAPQKERALCVHFYIEGRPRSVSYNPRSGEMSMISRHLVRITTFAGFVGLASPSYPVELYTLKEESDVGQLMTYLIILGYLNRATPPQSNNSRLALPDARAKNSPRSVNQIVPFGPR